MSVARMVGLASERAAQKQAALPAGTVASGGGGTKPVDSALEKLTAFIPSEVIAFYLTGLAMFKDVAAADLMNIKWKIFYWGLALIPAIMAISYFLKRKQGAAVPSVPIMVMLLIFGALSFVAWVAATPGTPFEEYTVHATKIGGLAVIPLAAVLWGIAEVFDAAPK